MSENDEKSLFSMEKLVEFGMGMAMSRQIVQSMNEMMCGMRLPNQINCLQNQRVQAPIDTQPLAQANLMPQVSMAAQNPATAANSICANFYVAFNGKQAGPFSETEIARLANEGKINKDTLVWRAGMSAWQKAENVSEVLRLIALAPPPIPEKPQGEKQ